MSGTEEETRANSGQIAQAFRLFACGAIDRREVLRRLGTLAGGTLAATTLLSLLERHHVARAQHSASAVDFGEIVMLSLQEMSDRLEIQQNVWDYANAVDLGEIDALDDVFVPEARLRYGGREMTYPEAKEWLRKALSNPAIRGYYHLMGSMRIRVMGDVAESLTRCFNPMEFIQKDGQVRLWLNGIWYHWRHVRTPRGWRIIGHWPQPVRRKVFDWSTPPYPATLSGAPLPE